MAAAHSSPLALPPPANMERLPSIRELHFSYRPPSAQGNNQPPSGQDHPPHPTPPSSRHDPSGWSRPPPSNAPPSSQHSPNMPPPPEHAKHHQAAHKADGAYGQPAHGYASHAPAAPASHPKSRGDAPRTSKRGRSDSSVSASAGRSPHTAYPPNYSHVQQSPTLYHPAPGGPSPQPPPEAIQQPSHFPPSGPGYAYHHPPPQHMAPRQQYTQQAPPAQPQQPHTRTPNPYHAPPPSAHEQWQHQQPPPSQQQAPPPAHPHPSQAPAHNQQYEFIRTTPIVPAPAEPRGAVAAPIPPPPQRENVVQEIVKYCNTLWGFASKYAQSQDQPQADELRDMSYFAGLVVHLLEDLRRMSIPQEQRQNVPPNSVAEEPRPPKRPWEDMSREEGPPAASPNHPELSEENQQSTAEQDMEIIRSKRATSSGTSTPGQPKSKYRKRSRATPPGKCHSCNIRETPEWRRGPDGARTLCNACGLHYAKLMRKRDKTLGADGKPVPIDLQTLRASTASSRGGGGSDQNGDSSQQAAPPPPPHHPGVAVPPYEHTKPGLHGPDSPQHPSPTHAVYHLMPSQGPPSAGAPPPHPSMHPPPPQPRGAHEHVGPGGYVPLPPWQAHGSGPSDHAYMRPSHGRGSPH